MGQGSDVPEHALRRSGHLVHGLGVDAVDQIGEVAHFALHGVGGRADYPLAGDAFGGLSLLSQLRVVHYDLHEWHFLKENLLLIVDVLS